MATPGRWFQRVWSARDRLHIVVLERSGLLPFVNLIGKAKVGSTIFRAPLTRGIGLTSTDPEPWLDIVLERLLRNRHGAFLDVGANIGQTLLKVKSLSPSIEYWGFEPNPRCYCYLQDLIALNSLSACRTYPFALGESAAVVDLFLHESSVDVAASVVDGFRPSTEYSSKQFASVFRGDDVVPRENQAEISVLKIDVEGAELEVILGLTETIRKARPPIVCEVLPVYDQQAAIGQFRLARQRRIESFLRENGYSIERIEKTGETTKLSEIGVHGDLEQSNYLFAPG